MFGRKNGAMGIVGEAAETLLPYADQLAHDERLRRRLAAAIGAAVAARRRAKRQAGLFGLAMRLGSDPVLRARISEAANQLQRARMQVEKKRSHRARNLLLVLTGAGAVVAGVPSLRGAVSRKLRGGADDWAPNLATVEQEIEIEVPVSTAYNQWTQFEEFPKFMEGVDEVTQLDDTLLHWAATVAGKKAAWDAKIVAQEPERRIAWESVDGKNTRGTVTFEQAGPARTRIRLNMSYTPEGVAEKVGSAAGFASRRVRGDLDRFRELVESQQLETGVWRGEIKDSERTGGADPGHN
jgi:uncharacterized membrane protein